MVYCSFWLIHLFSSFEYKRIWVKIILIYLKFVSFSNEFSVDGQTTCLGPDFLCRGQNFTIENRPQIWGNFPKSWLTLWNLWKIRKQLSEKWKDFWKFCILSSRSGKYKNYYIWREAILLDSGISLESRNVFNIL